MNAIYKVQNNHFLIHRPWARITYCIVLFLFCVVSCNDCKNPGFEQKLYFDSQGDKTADYVEGGIQIEYDKNDLTKFVVTNSTLTTYTHLLYTLKKDTISSVHVTIKSFIDSKGNISYNFPAEEKTQFIDFESTELYDNNYKKIGNDALKAIIHSVTKNE